MDVSNYIVQASMNMSAAQVQQQASVMMLDKTLDIQKNAAQELTAQIANLSVGQAPPSKVNILA